MRLYTNALVRPFSSATVLPAASAPDSILVDVETIVGVGGRAEMRELATGATHLEEIDCGGGVILPGFVDGHMHSVLYANSLTELDLSSARSLAEAVDLIRARAATIPAGQWVLGTGWDSNKWDVPVQPDRDLLDRAVPDHPVAMWSIDVHTLWVNGRTLEHAGVDRTTPNPTGGEFVHDHLGELTGVLREEAAEVVARTIPEASRPAQVERLSATQEAFLSVGLTGFHDFDGASATLGWQDMHELGRQAIRVNAYLRQEEIPWAIETGWRTGDGDAWLQRGGLKLFSDGALGSHTSHMSSHYPGEPENFGIAQASEETLFEQARVATEAGISVAIHAIGDQANHHVLEVFERLRPITIAAEKRLGRSLRHRIEHAQFIQPADVARLHQLEIIASMQPRHCISDLHLLHLVDETQKLAAYAWPDLLAAGAHLAFGSDGPVEPANPFAAVYAAMTRADIGGDPSTTFQPERRMTAVEAIREHTQGPAFAAGLEGRRGTLAPGMDADFIVVDVDPCDADGLDSAWVRAAAAGGTTGTAGTATSAGARNETTTSARERAGLLGYASEQALFAHAEAIRDSRVALTVVGGEVRHSA